MIGFINNEESQVIPENPPFRDFPTLLNSELQENLKTYLHSFDEIGSNSDDHLHDYYKALGSSSTATRERYGKLDKGQFIFSNPQDWSLGHFFNLYDDLPRIDQNAYMDTEEFTRLLKERELRQKIVDLEVIDQLDNRPFLFTEQEDIKDQYIFSQRKDDTYKLVFLNYGGTGRLASVTFCIGQENDQTNAIRSIEVSFLNKRVY